MQHQVEKEVADKIQDVKHKTLFVVTKSRGVIANVQYGRYDKLTGQIDELIDYRFLHYGDVDVTIKLHQDKRALDSQLRTSRNMSEPGAKLYYPLMLHQLPNEARHKNILVPDGMSKEQAHNAVDIVNQRRLLSEWTVKQSEAIAASKTVRAGINICYGAPGTGKTTVGVASQG